MSHQFASIIFALTMFVRIVACGESKHMVVAEVVGGLMPAQRQALNNAAREVDVRMLVSAHAAQDPYKRDKSYGTLECRTSSETTTYIIGVGELSQMFRAWHGAGVPSEQIEQAFLPLCGVEPSSSDCSWHGPIANAFAEADELGEVGDEMSEKTLAYLRAGAIPTHELGDIAPELLAVMCTFGVDAYCDVADFTNTSIEH